MVEVGREGAGGVLSRVTRVTRSRKTTFLLCVGGKG